VSLPLQPQTFHHTPIAAIRGTTGNARSMKPWPKVRLGEVLRHRKEFITIDDLRSYKRPRVQLHAKGIVLRDELPGALIKTKAQQVCGAGEFLVAEIDAKSGGFGIVPKSLEGAIVSSHYFLFTPNIWSLNTRFLEFFSRTRVFQDQVAAQGSTNYAAIRPSHVLDYEIPLPPLPEQRRIVERIESLNAEIAEAKGLRDEAVAEAAALGKTGAARAFDQMSASHPRVRLGDYVTIKGGGTPSKSNPAYWGGSVPWFTPKDMKRRELRDSGLHITESAARETAAKLIEPGAVLIVVRGMILAHTLPTAVLCCHATINQDMKALIPQTTLLPEFLCGFFWAKNHELLGLVEKSTHDTRKLESGPLGDICIPLPPLPEQRRNVAELDALQAEVDALKRLQAETAAELDALLPAVLDRAFRGEL
jgi:type I restriction enzyme S subunit